MPADIVIRGGTVFDGSGAPGRAADVAIADGVIREIGPNLRGDARARRVGLRGRARLHRHPHALRRAGVLGSGAAAVVVPRRHHRGRRQLRLHDRADPPRAPRRDRAHARERRGHGPGDARPRASRGTSRRSPSTSTSVRRRGTALNFTAYVGHSALRLYVMGDAAYERAATADEIERMCELVREAIDAGAAGFSTSFSYAHRGVDGKPVPSRFADARRGRGAVPRRGRGGQGRGAHHARRAVHLRRRLRVAAARRAAVHLPAVRERRAASTSSRSRCTSRASPTARRSGRRSRRGRSPCSSRWPTRTASTPARCSASCMKGGRAVRLAAYRDPAWRARAAADLEQSPMKPRWETFEVSESAALPRAAGPAGERPRARARRAARST